MYERFFFLFQQEFGREMGTFVLFHLLPFQIGSLILSNLIIGCILTLIHGKNCIVNVTNIINANVCVCVHTFVSQSCQSS